MEQNIYALDVTEVILRITPEDVIVFNQNNDVSIDQLKSALKDIEIECYFQKIPNEEYKIIIPILNGQLEAVCKIHTHTQNFKTYYSYRILIDKKKKTIFKNKQKFPEKSEAILESVIISIQDIEHSLNKPTSELEELIKKVHNLSLASVVNVENQQGIWYKWIEAQKAIVQNLQIPYPVKGAPVIQEIKNNKDEIISYILKFDLTIEILPEYRLLERELNDLGIKEKFDKEGNIFLTREQLTVLDTIIDRNFSDRFERSKTISTIIKLRPLTLAQKIQREIGIKVSQNHNLNQIFIQCKSDKTLNDILRQKGFEFKSFKAEFIIINHGNIIENDSINSDYHLSFGNQFMKPDHVPEMLLPYPVDNKFIVNEVDYFKLQLFLSTLTKIYGKENIKNNIFSVYDAINPEQVRFFDKAFEEDFWTEMKRKLYIYNLEDAVSPLSQSLYLEFNNVDELENQLNIIQDLQMCDITYSPMEKDFKFKIKTNVIAKKTEKELYLEKLKLLRGAEFVVEVLTKDSKRIDLVYLGKLNSKDSDIQKIVLYLPYIFKDDQRKAKEVLKVLSNENQFQINEIRANLRGDETKIDWLQKALEKITDASDAPNGKAVNDKLGEYIFDTSKATPIYDIEKVTANSEYYWEVRNNELLRLNESQRKAVLSAIHCSDLALLQGPPGTGKTTVIAEIIWQIISKNPKHRILLTSETNLAVDNALDRLLNIKGVNPNLSKYTTLIKPLRFGRMGKMDEEGAKYSVDRILAWVNESRQDNQDTDYDTIDESNEDEENAENNSIENNAVQDWMKRIASRAKNNDPRYSAALKDWALDLSFPSNEIKHIFKEKYFEYANVVGSTCSSSGSPRFMWDTASVFFESDCYSLKEMNFLSQVAPFGNSFKDALSKSSIPPTLKSEFKELQNKYDKDMRVVKNYFHKEDHDQLEEIDIYEFEDLHTINHSQIKDRKDNKKLYSYKELINFSKEFIAPYFEPQIQFDTVIMDEASKATPPELVLPLCFGKRNIIIGDHRQLPPMLNEKDFKEALQEANAGNLVDEIDREYTETSQFERMILNPGVSPTIISRCNIQYRMHPDINDVISQFYSNTDEGDTGLFPAQELIENANDINLDNIFSRHHGLYHSGLIDINTHVIWVDVKTPESRVGTSVTNEGEAKAIRMVIEMIKNAEGFETFQNHWNFIKDEFKCKQEKEIGVISFYGEQKKLIKRNLTGVGIPLKINTVDRFQGMERNIIIVSTVRSDQQLVFGGKVKPNIESGFAKSPQRLNVALSRARRLLIVVGNKDFFEKVTDNKGKPLYKNAINQIEKNGRIINFEEIQKQFIK